MLTTRLSPLVFCHLALLAVCATVGCASEGDDPVQDAGFVALVEPDELSADQSVVLDVRSLADYDAGHVPGALHFEAGTLRATVDGVEGQVADRDTAQQAFSRAGLGDTLPIVVLGADNGTDPARVAWTLRYYGYEASVALLDGGMDAYRDAGLPEDTEPAAGASDTYSGAPTRSTLRVDKAWMLENLDNPDVEIFDVRTAGEFSEGHIPGANNVNWEDNVGTDGRFLSTQDVRENHGDTDAPILVVYCRTGSRAAVSWALLLSAGYTDVRLYDGSWAEWGADPQTPKE